MTLALLCSPSLAKSSPQTTTAQQAVEKTQLVHLPNGLSVLVIPDERFPLVSLRLYVHAGSAYETPEQAGISHLLEHMVFKGTAKRPKGTIAKEVEELGGYINAATSFDYTVYIVDVPSEHWQQGLDILNDMACNATINPKDLEDEKKVVLSELERGEDSPHNYMFQSIQAHALAGTSYERPIIGYRETVSSLTRKDIKDYIATWYQPQSMLLVVCGRVNPADVIKEADKFFGKMHNTHQNSPQPAIDPASLQTGVSITVEKRPLNKVYFNAVMPVPGYTADVEPVLEVLAHLLGGDKTSLIYRKYKYDTQMVDDISVYLYSFERVGLLYFSAVMDEKNLEPFWKEFTKDLPKISSASFTEKELDRAKLNIEDNLFRAKETISGLASKSGSFYFQTGNLDGERDYLNSLRAITLDDIQQQIDLWFKPTAISTVALTPESFQAPDLIAPFDEAWQNWSQPAVEKNVNKNKEAIAADKTYTLSAADAAPKDGDKNKEIIDLGNGRTLILIPDNTLPYISVSLAFSGGDLLLTEQEQGLDDLVAATLTKGTKHKTAPDMEIYLAERAASLSAGASRQTFAVGGSFPERFSQDMFSLINEVLKSPTFALDEVEREKSSQIAEIRSSEDQPLGLAFRRLMPFLFPNHTLGFYRNGEPDTVAAFTIDQVNSYWKKQLAQPWVLSVCGQFNRDEIIAFAEKLPEPSAQKPVMHKPEWAEDKNLLLNMPGRNQSHILMVFETAPAKSEDNPKLEVLNTILSGQGGLLFRQLRDEQSLGYSVTSIKWQTDQTGLLAFYIGTEPEKTDEAIAGFEKIIHKLQTELLGKELLAGAVNQLEGEYYRTHQSLGSRSSEASGLTIQGYPLDYNTATIDAARQVTPKQIQEIANKYLIPGKAYIIRVDP